MWRQVVSQTPQKPTSINSDHPYAKAAAQLNGLIRGGKSLSGRERNCVFLNIEGKEFATASSIAGFDFEDDSRAIAKCDWDFDGDLDFWVANRTAPQIRFLENRAESKNNFITFRLRGTQSNRDAIGAQVRIQTDSSSGELVGAVRAGEGFLAQSSKLVHFGIGDATQVSSVSVRWPNGETEQFTTPPHVNKHYLLTEGSGVAKAWSVPATTVRNKNEKTEVELTVPAFTQATANPLCVPFPLPPLSYKTSKGETKDATEGIDQALAINLWSSGCDLCRKELADWQKHRNELHQAKIRVLALSVDAGLGTGTDNAAKVLEEIDFAFETGTADDSTLETVQIIHNAIYDQHETLPVPTTLLLNPSGQLVALFKGGVTTEELSQVLKLTREPDPDARLPFRGRWIGRLAPYKLSSLASELWDVGFTKEALEFANRINSKQNKSESIKSRISLAYRLKQDKQIQESMEQLQLAYGIDPKHPDVNFQIGALQAEYGKLPLAVGHYLIAIENSKDDPRPDIHANLGATLRRLNDIENAEKHLAKAIELDERQALAYHNLGLIQSSKSRHGEAIRNLRQAVQLEPKIESYRINLAMALSRADQHAKAIEQLDEVLRANPASTNARIYKGEVYATSNQLVQAEREFKGALEKSPKATRVWLRLGQVQQQRGKLREALRSFESARSRAIEDPRAATLVAWILATAPSDDLRDGARALILAKGAVARTNAEDPMALDSLAAAYAEIGDFETAVAQAGRAISLLSDTLDVELKREIAARQSTVQSKPSISNEVDRKRIETKQRFKQRNRLPG